MTRTANFACVQQHAHSQPSASETPAHETPKYQTQRSCHCAAYAAQPGEARAFVSCSQQPSYAKHQTLLPAAVGTNDSACAPQWPSTEPAMTRTQTNAIAHAISTRHADAQSRDAPRSCDAESPPPMSPTHRRHPHRWHSPCVAQPSQAHCDGEPSMRHDRAKTGSTSTCPAAASAIQSERLHARAAPRSQLAQLPAQPHALRQHAPSATCQQLPPKQTVQHSHACSSDDHQTDADAASGCSCCATDQMQQTLYRSTVSTRHEMMPPSGAQFPVCTVAMRPKQA